jgi:hypothetical protein
MKKKAGAAFVDLGCFLINDKKGPCSSSENLVSILAASKWPMHAWVKCPTSFKVEKCPDIHNLLCRCSV